MSKERVLAEAIRETLLTEGYSIDDIRESVPKNFWVKVFRNRSLAPYFSSRNMASNYFSRPSHKKVILSLVEGSPRKEPLQMSISAYAPEMTEQRVREIVQEELKQLPDSYLSAREVFELCAESPNIIGEGKGRRQERVYDRVSITVDRVLWKMFKDEQKRLQINAPRLMDSILWHRYGKPKLSFEMD